MTPNEYQQAAARTLNNTGQETLINCALGLAGEAGEVIELIKKYKFHGRSLDLDDVTAEVGDLLFYAAGILTALSLSLEDAMLGNIEKLKARYPNGFVLGGGIRDNTLRSQGDQQKGGVPD